MQRTDLPQSHRRATRPARRSGDHPIVAGVAMAAIVLLAAGCASGPASAPSTASSGGSAPMITISNFMFVPSTLTVRPGEKVTVENHDQVAHTVTSSTGAFTTGDIAPGATVTFVAPRRAGTFPYICSIHQYMTGTLTVS